MSEKVIGKYEITVVGRNIEITVKEKSNTDYPYNAVASLKNISGIGKTVEEAKRKCEAAVKLDIITNRA